MRNDIISASKLDFSSYADVQKAAFAQHLKKYDVDTDYMTESYFRWKYITPWGDAKIAVVYEGERLVASTAAVPLQVNSKNSAITAWRIVDIATIPSARRKGYFSKMLYTLKESLLEDEILFAFPNANSTPGFLKNGSVPVQEIPTWIRFVPPGFGQESQKKIIHLNQCSLNEFKTTLSYLPQISSTHVSRDFNYYKWRYILHPLNEYFLVDGQDGIIVFREMELFNRKVLVILENWSGKNTKQRQLIRPVIDYAHQKSINFIVSVTNSFDWKQSFANYFIKVPYWVSPKRQILQGFSSGVKGSDILKSDWRVMMGDLLEF